MSGTTESTQVPNAAIFRRVWAISYDLPGTEDTALFDETTSGLVLINDVGAAIWDIMDGARSVADMVKFIVEVRGSPEESDAIQRDVTQFLAEMLDRGSIARVS